jgi:hypothetical protein
MRTVARQRAVLNDDVIVLLTGIRIFFEGFISTAGMRELSAHFRLDVDYSAHVILLFAEFVSREINSSQNRIQSRQYCAAGCGNAVVANAATEGLR